ncbi:hypothetical protein M0R45_016538 [Rubus argutus]|uniref:Uncharacterized protein n=1 Tax=Rubus argutus TaxID=59490 RepID=A0AAW1XS84_RUBAR
METARRVVEEKSIEIRLRKKKKRTKKVESLYLCFNRTMNGGPGRFVHVVLSIKLTDLFSSKSKDHPSGGAGDGDGDGKGEGSETIITIDGNSKFRQVGYIEGDEEDDIPYWMNSGVFRSKIIMAGVSPIRWFSNVPPGRNEILVFDPTADPHLEPDSHNIRIKPFQMTGGFIGRKPCPLLVELEGRLYALGSRPSSILQSPVFEDEEENKDGAFVIFSYCHFPPEESSISVSILSQQCDSWKTMKSLKLPQLPPEFHSRQYTGFFHLGGRRLCLFMHKFISLELDGIFPVEFPEYGDMGLLLVVPFEYKIIELGSDSCSVTANFEALRKIEYTPKPSDRNSHQVVIEHLYGAFVL